MSVILTALGWLAAIGLLALAVSSAWHGIRDKASGPWVAAGLYACGAVCLLAVDGVVAPLTAGVLAFLAAATAAGLALKDGRENAARNALGHAGAGLGFLGRDALGIWQRITARPGGRGGEADRSGGEWIETAVGDALGARVIPPVMADPFLGPAPEPAALATAAPVPAPYAALASYIGSFVPEDDQALKMFMQSNAAGECAIADAWHAFADTCLGGVGLDPAYVAGILEAGDSAGNHASLLAQVHKRFGVVYAAVQEWISAGRQLPHKARDFLTGEAA